MSLIVFIELLIFSIFAISFVIAIYEYNRDWEPDRPPEIGDIYRVNMRWSGSLISNEREDDGYQEYRVKQILDDGRVTMEGNCYQGNNLPWQEMVDKYLTTRRTAHHNQGVCRDRTSYSHWVVSYRGNSDQPLERSRGDYNERFSAAISSGGVAGAGAFLKAQLRN